MTLKHQYRPEIDGLRAIAVIMVIIFHLNPQWLLGGFIGVDIFFVISGYLITSVFIKNGDNEKFSLMQFWGKRMKRLLPAVLTLLIGIYIYSYYFGYFGDWPSLSIQSLATLMGLANVEMWKHGQDYWGGAAENMPLLHMWSLAVEEQFYLLYPLIYKLFRKKFFLIVICLTLLSLGLNLYVTNQIPSMAFYFLPTRAWELGVGAMVALLPYPLIKQKWLKIIQYTGFTLIILSSFVISEKGFPGYQALLPVLATAIFIYSSQHKSLLYQLLSANWIRLIGKWSYSLYLWHWPIIVYYKQYALENQTSMNYGLVIFMIIACSVSSYYLIENRFRYYKSKIYAGIIITSISCACIAIAFYFIHPYNLANYKKVAWYGDLYANNNNPQKGIMHQAKFREYIFPEKSPQLNSSYKNGGVCKLYGDQDIDMIIYGSSHGQMWSSTIDSIAQDLELDVSFYSAGGISAIFKKTEHKNDTESYIHDFNQARYKYFMDWKPRIVFILDRWSTVNYSKQEFQEFMQLFNNDYTQVVFISEPAYFPQVRSSSLKYFADKARGPNDDLILDASSSQSPLVKWAVSKYDYCHYLDVRDLYFVDKKLEQGIFAKQGDLIYTDGHHLSDYGALLAKPRIKQLVQQLITP